MEEWILWLCCGRTKERLDTGDFIQSTLRKFNVYCRNRSLMANEIDWVYMFPAVKIPFKSDCEFQIEALMDNTFKPRPLLPGADLTAAA